MSTHKHVNLVAVVAMCLAVALTVFCICGTSLGVIVTAHAMGYESRLFDTERVHTVDIVMDDWDEFISTCQSEEYSPCTVVIDGEKYANIGIRGKGNTSLSNVSSMGSERYSFKLEFDQYQTGNTYHGLDKLCLNNIIQDNTYMKDYLAYRMMAEFGVDAPLCSFVYITVNGEDWGLYLAVEGIEDSFLQRNYGTDYGNLYKPDSLSFGGGRGNGKDFNMDDLDFDFGFSASDDASGSDLSSGQSGSDFFRMMGDMDLPEDMELPTMPGGQMPDMSAMFDGSDRDAAPATGTDLPSNTNLPSETDLASGGKPSMGGFGGGGGFGMGSSDVKLQYIDDDPDSYSNIFNSAKTEITDTDKDRLIDSLKSLSDYENLDEVLDTDEVLRYFVVHNFVVNGDSYTGSMIHNYYLYEENGKLSMIPWDYNLAYGTFQGNDASGSVNDPIDDVLDDRPMQAWIFSDEAYTKQYHALYQEFLQSVDIQSMLDEAYELIAPYVEKDPTAFCTYEEFEAGVAALREFCSLRSESVMGQLTGSIPSTSETQQADSSALVDTGDLDLSDMGTMSTGGGMDGGSKPDNKPDDGQANAETGNEASAPQMPDMGNFDPTQKPDMGGNQMPQMPGGMMPQGGTSQKANP